MAEATPTGASPAAPIKEPAFPTPKPEHPAPSKHAVTATDMADRYEEERAEHLAEIEKNDPVLARLRTRTEAEQRASSSDPAHRGNAPEESSSEGAPDILADGTASVDPMHPPAEPEVDPTPEADPEIGSEHVVMKDGVPHMRLNVDGQIQFMPVDKALAELQKGQAGDARLAQASQMSRELQTREQHLNRQEQALNERVRGAPVTPSTDAGLPDFTVESKQVLNSFLEGDEDDAAQQLGGLIQKAVQYGRATPPAAPDPDALREAARAVRAEERELESAEEILGKFKEAFPELESNQEYFQMADKQWEMVQAEHPEWAREQVMQEAGNRTRRWVKERDGVSVEEPTPTPREEPPVEPSPPSERRNAKSTLVPMPSPRTGTQAPPVEEVPQTREEYLAEVREQRNQPS